MNNEELLKISTEILTAYIKSEHVPYISSNDVKNHPDTLLPEDDMKLIEQYTKLSVKIAKMLINEVNLNSNINTKKFDHYITAKENFEELLNCEQLGEMSERMSELISHIPFNNRYEYLVYMKNLILNIKINYGDKYETQKYKLDALSGIIYNIMPIYK